MPIGLLLLMATMAPSTAELARFREGSSLGIRVLGPPFAHSQRGIRRLALRGRSGHKSKVKERLREVWRLLPTLNLTFDAMLAYLGKTFVPIHMSASYTW